MEILFEKGYTFKMVRTSHGSYIYISRFGQVVKVVSCGSQINISNAYFSNLINQIESTD
jgi:hypothetical protein